MTLEQFISILPGDIITLCNQLYDSHLDIVLAVEHDPVERSSWITTYNVIEGVMSMLYQYDTHCGAIACHGLIRSSGERIHGTV